MHIDGTGGRSPCTVLLSVWSFLFRYFILVIVYGIWANPRVECVKSMRDCPDRHDWAKSIFPRRVLVLGALFPGDELLPSLQPAIHLAKQDIHRNKCVLTHYDLEVSNSDTGVSTSFVTDDH